ncbi:hypothetical protein KOI35_30735 [Actinoplanes bogorensis]|uniref:Uncharacterized protein n=1 Tax=Paractinoplanes bogorensis TaxID=1610840 RepID=A0ABS5YXU8_9ACTN|nr:hypothetical protein [Actinoplanes bogorensis]MBU2667896.1 hypothetical protein [Actinoplanes bogorensis]
MRDSVLDVSGGGVAEDELTAVADGVQQRRPGGAAGLQSGDDRVRPARDHAVFVPSAAVAAAAPAAFPPPRGSGSPVDSRRSDSTSVPP